MSFFVGAILPTVTILAFVGGMVYRITTWRKHPRPPMTLYPNPESDRERFTEILGETFLFRRLFKGDTALWVLAWVFHLMLAVSLIVHYDRILAYMGLTSGVIVQLPISPGGLSIGEIAGGLMLVLVLLLAFRRVVLKRVAQITALDDYFALGLILAVVVTGDALRFMSSFDLVQMQAYFAGLLAFSYKGLPDNPWFLTHYLLAQLLIIYIPFSKILHLGGLYFSQLAVRKN